jgi:CRISP-associated protein Cas1
MTFSRAVTADPRVLVIDSYVFSMSVRRGSLVIKSGMTERMISRDACSKRAGRIARILILSHAGTVSIAAMRWCAALDVAVYQVDRNCTVNLSSPGMIPSDARLYRRQVLAQDDMLNADLGLSLTRELLTAKIMAQHELASSVLHSPFKRIADYTVMLSRAGTLRELLAVEGNASKHFWRIWQGRVFAPIKPSDRKYLPEHWSRFNGRAVKTREGGYRERSNRHATDLVNAMLNYAYKIAETEASYAAWQVGLHPALGLAHGMNDKDSPGMALDILEPLRPIVDAAVLSYLDCGNGIPLNEKSKPAWISRDSAYELPNGVCRLFPPMTSQLASSVSMAVASHAARWAERIARSLTHTDHISTLAPFDPRLRDRPHRFELGSDVTAEDIVPDEMWFRIQPILPQFTIGKHSADARRVLAGVILHEIYGLSYSAKNFDSRRFCNWQTARKRLEHWQQLGVWETIREIVTRPGISQTLTAGLPF